MAFEDWHHDNKQFIPLLALIGIPTILGFFGYGVGFLAFVFLFVFFGGLYGRYGFDKILQGHHRGLPERSVFFKIFCWLMVIKCVVITYFFYSIDNYSETVINLLHLQEHMFLSIFIPFYSMLAPFWAIGYIYMATGRSFHQGAISAVHEDEDSRIQDLIKFREGIMGTLPANKKAELMLQTSQLDLMASNSGPYSTPQGQKVKRYVNGMLGSIGGGQKKLDFIKSGKY